MTHEDAVRHQAVERYWLGELSTPEREEFEEHFFACPACEEALQVTESLEANAKAAGWQKTSEPTIRSWTPWLGAVAAALLAGVFGFDHLVRIPAYQSQIAALSAPQVVEPVVIYEAQRGGDRPTVVLPKGADVYYLKLDIAEQSSAGYDCLIQTRDGVMAEELKGVRPAANGELSLRLDAKRTPPGDYDLVLKKAGSSEAGNRYPFSVRTNQ